MKVFLCWVWCGRAARVIHGVGTNPAGDLLPASQPSRRSLVWQGGVEPPKRLEVDFGGHRRQLFHETPEIVTSTAPNDATGSPPAPAPRRASCHRPADQLRGRTVFGYVRFFISQYCHIDLCGKFSNFIINFRRLITFLIKPLILFGLFY